ncbi:MAG: hypothetical protein ACRBCT_01645 [Alphaproteobacteria bacterium]
MTHNEPSPETREALAAEMAEICKDLRYELETPNPIATSLERQTVILDRLLYAVMRRALKDNIENDAFNQDHLNKILRIQKQSADSYKMSTRSATWKASSTHISKYRPVEMNLRAQTKST